MVKAAQKGFATAKPYGDSRRYDFIVDVGATVVAGAGEVVERGAVWIVHGELAEAPERGGIALRPIGN